MEPLWSEDPGPYLLTPRWELLKVVPGKAVGGICINERITGAFLHWVKNAGPKGMDVPCVGPERCPHCPYSAKWRGYIPVWRPQYNSVSVLPLTPGAVKQMDDAEIDRRKLRGKVISFSREKATVRSPYLFHPEFLDDRLEEIEEIKEISLSPYLQRMWKLAGATWQTVIEQALEHAIQSDDKNLIPY